MSLFATDELASAGTALARPGCCWGHGHWSRDKRAVLAMGLFPTDRPDAFWKAFARFIGRFLSCLLHTHEGGKKIKKLNSTEYMIDLI